MNEWIFFFALLFQKKKSWRRSREHWFGYVTIFIIKPNHVIKQRIIGMFIIIFVCARIQQWTSINSQVGVECLDCHALCELDNLLSKKLKIKNKKIIRTNKWSVSHFLILYSCHITTETASNVFMRRNYWRIIKSISKMIAPIIQMKNRELLKAMDTMKLVDVDGCHLWKIEKITFGKTFFLKIIFCFSLIYLVVGDQFFLIQIFIYFFGLFLFFDF